MKITQLTMLLMLAMPCAMIQASHNNDLEVAQYLIQEYNNCLDKAERRYFLDKQKEDLHKEKDRCTIILSRRENDSECRRLKEENALLKTLLLQSKK
jgi:hypothetical protein